MSTAEVFSVLSFDSQTFVVIHNPSATEVCVCGRFEGEIAPARQRAEVIADLLNKAGILWDGIPDTFKSAFDEERPPPATVGDEGKSDE